MNYVAPLSKLGDTILTEPLARYGGLVGCRYPEIFDNHPTIRLLGNGEGKRLSFGGYSLPDGITSAPRLYLSPDEERRATSIRKKGHIGIGWRSDHPQKMYPYLRLLVDALPNAICFDEREYQKGVFNVVGKPLREVMSWIAGMKLMICIDTGLAHLAAALRVPTFAIGINEIRGLYEIYPTVTMITDPSMKTISVKRIIKVVNMFLEEK